MFEVNENAEIKTEYAEGSALYVIDNFYQEPDKVLELLRVVDPNIWKENQKPSYNQIYFDDRRHFFRSQEVKKVYDFLGKICNQHYLNFENLSNDVVLTNLTKFKRSDFNDYKNNYWWPHEDAGYTAIVYLNANDTESGTNLYENLNPDEEPPNCPEHYQPWRSKSNYRLIKTIKPKYNRMVLFDGFKFVHGMNICNDDYFGDTYRINQVFFFKDKDY